MIVVDPITEIIPGQSETVGAESVFVDVLTKVMMLKEVLVIFSKLGYTDVEE